ncbi:Dirigent protein 23 [Abeliophyllum distichum]|uniref:Dirigent protein n=1 Tax=Abeliophyllum distichum TaxID=126358 RepID=A0ABD1RQD0_9LAMI
MLCSLVIFTAAVQEAAGLKKGPEAVEKWFKKLPEAKEKVTKLHFYFHDTVSGKNSTAFVLAQSNITSTSPTFFGVFNVADDPLTIGPEPDSKIVGRAQGIYGTASLEEIALLMTLNFVFTDGKYNGSTLSVLGHNPILHKYREMPIVGGSGVFRLARGIATAQTVWYNRSSNNAVVEYTVMVLHY